MGFDNVSNLVFCPGCGNIQNQGEACIKCGTFIGVESKEEHVQEPRDGAHRTEKAKVSLVSRRGTKKPRASAKERHRTPLKQAHPRKDRIS